MSDEITPEAIRAGMDAGTPGPWELRYEQGQTHIYMPRKGGGMESQMCDETYYPWVPDNEADWERIAGLPDLERAYLDAMAENERMREALASIAHQKRSDELETVADEEYADFTDGFDACVNVARAALGHTPPETTS